MSAELTMPKLSDSMADAVIIKWLKSPGEGFRRGDALIEVETDKATVVYEAEDDGTLGAILVPEGGTAAVGQPIAQLGSGNGAPPVVVRLRAGLPWREAVRAELPMDVLTVPLGLVGAAAGYLGTEMGWWAAALVVAPTPLVPELVLVHARRAGALAVTLPPPR